MENEEALKHRLPDEQWAGRRSISAISTSRNWIGLQTALQLMKRIALEYEFTAAAAKARQHLERLGETLDEKQELLKEESEEPPEEPFSKPKKRKKIKQNLPCFREVPRV
jgi:hypothetical protein